MSYILSNTSKLSEPLGLVNFGMEISTKQHCLRCVFPVVGPALHISTNIVTAKGDSPLAQKIAACAFGEGPEFDKDYEY